MLANQPEQLAPIDLESSILSLSDLMPRAADGFNIVLEGVREYPIEFLRQEDVVRIKNDVRELLECWFKDYFFPEQAKLYGKYRENASNIVREIAGFLSQNKVLWPFFSDFFRDKFDIVIEEKNLTSQVKADSASNGTKKVEGVRKYSCINRVLDRRQILQFFRACGFTIIEDSGKGGHMGIYLNRKKVGSYSGHDGLWIRAIMDELANNAVPLSVLANGYNETFGSGFVILT